MEPYVNAVLVWKVVTVNPLAAENDLQTVAKVIGCEPVVLHISGPWIGVAIQQKAPALAGGGHRVSPDHQAGHVDGVNAVFEDRLAAKIAPLQPVL
ncbi:MAG: hypothetical protein Q8Q59_11020 [Luteolibacter sp.]|nr:hypothetical protein [Luteolibacter sp.]